MPVIEEKVLSQRKEETAQVDDLETQRTNAAFMEGDFNIDVGDVEFETDQAGDSDNKPAFTSNPFGNKQGISMSASADHCHFPSIH